MSLGSLLGVEGTERLLLLPQPNRLDRKPPLRCGAAEGAGDAADTAAAAAAEATLTSAAPATPLPPLPETRLCLAAIFCISDRVDALGLYCDE